MAASQRIPDFSSHPKIIQPGDACSAMLRSLADAFEAAFNAPIPALCSAERIAELAGVEYVGRQEVTDGEPLQLFRDPQTGSTLALPESELTIARIQERLAESRAQFAKWNLPGRS